MINDLVPFKEADEIDDSEDIDSGPELRCISPYCKRESENEGHRAKHIDYEIKIYGEYDVILKFYS